MWDPDPKIKYDTIVKGGPVWEGGRVEGKARVENTIKVHYICMKIV
jgi:hypothetical protein